MNIRLATAIVAAAADEMRKPRRIGRFARRRPQAQTDAGPLP